MHHLKRANTQPRVHTHTNRINRSYCNWIKFSSHEKCFCHEVTAKKKCDISSKPCLSLLCAESWWKQRNEWKMQFSTENRNDRKTRNQHFYFVMFFLFVFLPCWILLKVRWIYQVWRFGTLNCATIYRKESFDPMWIHYVKRYNTIQWWRQNYPIFSAKHVTKFTLIKYTRIVYPLLLFDARKREKKTNRLQYDFVSKKWRNRCWNIFNESKCEFMFISQNIRDYWRYWQKFICQNVTQSQNAGISAKVYTSNRGKWSVARCTIAFRSIASTTKSNAMHRM